MDILIVDDEPNIRKTMALHFNSSGHRATAVATADAARQAVADATFDVAFVDLRLGTETGLDLLVDLRQRLPGLPVVVITAYASVDTAVEAMKRGAADYLPKPFVPAQLDLLVERIARMSRLESRVRVLESERPSPARDLEAVSRSCVMKALITSARKAASSDARLLLRGESGTGKTMLAHAIHDWSPRREAPFVTVSCPAIPAELLESELFGHARGAFTGAARDNPGRIAMAEGGTLLLDEIGDLPLSLQPKLLRFVQEGAYERVGDSGERRSNVRLVAATNCDLEQAVKESRFREDLYYRLAVVTLDVPPLRERREDIVPLAELLLRELATRGRGLHLTAEAARSLEARDWPGNVRELRNVLERAVIFAETCHIGADLVSAPGVPSSAPRLGDPVALAEIERAHIEAVIARSPSLKAAATTLGIDPATLWRRRKPPA